MNRRRLQDQRDLILHAVRIRHHLIRIADIRFGDFPPAREFWLQDFVEYIRANQDVASRLIVELTETAALHHFEENARFVTQLKELGVRVAIDDFGAGYTSFRNLQLLHVDIVKIDGSYVKNLSESPENQVFVRTLVGLAKNFDMRVVAEWVGSDADAFLLQSFGVDYFQGFHFGEPVIDPKWDQ